MRIKFPLILILLMLNFTFSNLMSVEQDYSVVTSPYDQQLDSEVFDATTTLDKVSHKEISYLPANLETSLTEVFETTEFLGTPLRLNSEFVFIPSSFDKSGAKIFQQISTRV